MSGDPALASKLAWRIHYNGPSLPFTVPSMRQRSKGSAPRLSADSQRLVDLAAAMIQAGSRLELRSWQQHLDVLLRRILQQNRQETIDQALDHLFSIHSLAYEPLLEAAEHISSTDTLEQGNRTVQLIALPILAWTRYAIPCGKINATATSQLAKLLHEKVLAPDARAVLLPALFSIDLLPQTHAETFALTQQLIKLVQKEDATENELDTEDAVPFLADTRYLLGAVVTQKDSNLFQWQSNNERALSLTASKEKIYAAWQEHATGIVQALMPGCGVDLLLPETFYTACRTADRQIRPISIHAAIHYLTQTLQIRPLELAAIIGGFSNDTTDDMADEHRISFTLRGQSEVLYGVVWPLYEEDAAAEEMQAQMSAENAPADSNVVALSPLEQILSLLRQDGIVHIKRHRERFPLEYCDDCGSPLFCDAEAELTHAEMPEIAAHAPPHLH